MNRTLVARIEEANRQREAFRRAVLLVQAAFAASTVTRCPSPCPRCDA
jgi:hypothetical protein